MDIYKSIRINLCFQTVYLKNQNTSWWVNSFTHVHCAFLVVDYIFLFPGTDLFPLLPNPPESPFNGLKEVLAFPLSVSDTAILIRFISLQLTGKMFISVNHFSLKYTESIFKWPCFYGNGIADCQWNQWWSIIKEAKTTFIENVFTFLLLCWSSFYKLFSQGGQVIAILLGPALPSSGAILLPIGSDFVWHRAALALPWGFALQPVPWHLHPTLAGNCLFSYWAEGSLINFTSTILGCEGSSCA